jgi:dihydropteroate synthase
MNLIDQVRRAHDRLEPMVMGVVNVTPDSFSDGGQFSDTERAIAHAVGLASEGAVILDIGGESTRPGAAAVSLDEELARVVPVIEGLRRSCDSWISIDTSKPEVMRAAVAAGADLINDVNALRAPGALEAAVELDVPVCLMHMQGQPRTMQKNPQYDDVLGEIGRFLDERIQACEAAGLGRDRLIIDPGFGFGKTLEHNLALLNGLASLRSSGVPILAGLSRKSMIGAITGREKPRDRLAGSLAGALLAAQQGAAILRVHDVAETVDVVKVWLAARAAASHPGELE